MQRDEGVGFDTHAEEFSIAPRPGKMGHDESLGAALVALDKGMIRWSYINIQSFFVRILEIRSIGAEELTGGEAKASSPGDLERGQAMDVWLGHFVEVIHHHATQQTTH